MIGGQLRPVFKLTESCNLACKYCYEEDKLGSGFFMDQATLEKALQEVASNTRGTIHLLWFGGEPTLYGLKRFKQAMELVDKYFAGRTVYHGMQTNGSLVDEQWANFLAERRFAVTVSLDGPQWLHDKQRPQRCALGKAAQGSFELVMRGIENLRKVGINPRVSAVATPEALLHPEELVEWFEAQGFKEMDFVPSTRYHQGKFEVEVDGHQFKEFIMRVLDRWLTLENPNFKVRLLSETARKLAGKTPHYCKLEGRCSHFVGFDHNGDVYPCDEFSSIPEVRLGNIHEHSLKELMTSEKAIEFFRQWAQVPPACTKCKWFHFYRGGCAWERQLSGSPDSPTIMCEALQAIFERLSKELGVEAPTEPVSVCR